MARRREPEYEVIDDAALDALLAAEAAPQDEAAQTLARYRAANPQDTQARVVRQGEPGYPGSNTRYDEPSRAYVALNDSQMLAAQKAEELAQGSGATQAAMQGLTLGFSDELAGLSGRLGQASRNIIRDAQGQPIEIGAADYGQAVQDATRAEQDRFAREQPVANVGLQVAGGALTGGLGAGRAGIGNALRFGTGYGAAAGFGGAEGSFAERLPSAAIGAGIGGVTGGVVQGVGQVVAPRVGPSVSSVVDRITSIANPGGAARSATRRMGPEAGAAVRLNQMITPESYARRDELAGIGINGSVLDTFDNTGERLIRSAAGPAGPGADLAVRNARARTVDLKPAVMGDTRGLSPEARTAPQVRQALEDTRGTLATEMYAPAYATPVPVTPEIISALSDAPGRAALSRARQAAVARRNDQQVQEIDRLLSGEVGGDVSAGTLDRVRIALGNRAEALGRNATGARDVAGGLRSRAGDIDAALANVDQLAPARAAYADLSGAMEQIDNASGIFNTDPTDFAAQVANLTPTQREAAVIGLRQEILDTLGGQRAAGTGALDRLSSSDYARRNLETLLGPQEAQRYIAQIEARVQQTQRANRVSPNTNSQTFGRGLDDETFNAANMVGAAVDAGQAATGNLVAIGRTIDRLRARATLSPQEREAIVRLGLGPAEDLERIVRLAEEATRRGGRNREVTAYLTRTRNVLGAQSPVTQQLEQLLSPATVAAEEEPQ